MFTRLFSKTLKSDVVVFRRAERSFFAQRHVKNISFFPVRDIPLRFISLNFHGTCWSDLTHFCISTTTSSRFITFQISWGRIFFWRVIQSSDFLEGKGYIFESCFYSKLGNANVFALIDGTPSSWAAYLDISCQIVFSASFRAKKRRTFWIFQKQILATKFCVKNDFSNKLHYLKFSAFSMPPQSDTYHLNWWTD